MAEAGAVGGPLDQAGDVGDDHLAVVAVDRPQHRRERRERVVGDLRRRPGSAAPAARTCRRWAARPGRRRRAASAAARSSPLLALGPLLGEARRLAGRGGEALVAMPPAPAVRDHRPLARLDQVDPAAIQASPASRAAPQSPGPPPAPRAGSTLPRADPCPARKCLLPRSAPKIAARRLANEHHVPPMPPVATVRPTPRHVRLTAKTDAPVPAGPTFDADFRLVVHQPRA